MGRTKLRWNMGGFTDIRRDPGVIADIDGRAADVAAAAGDGYETGSWQGKTRYRGSVITATARAQKDQAKNNTLQRSLDAGRG